MIDHDHLLQRTYASLWFRIFFGSGCLPALQCQSIQNDQPAAFEFHRRKALHVEPKLVTGRRIGLAGTERLV